MNPPPLKPQVRSRTIFGFVVVLVIIGLFTFSPILMMLIANWITTFEGCDIIIGSARGCMFGGSDYGSALLFMQHAGWFMFYTIPLGLIAFLAWLVFAIARFASRDWNKGASA